jgi:transposase
MLYVMARAYDDDLRRKFLEAYDAGEGSLRSLAVRFRVSAAWAFKVHADRKKTGVAERPPEKQRGPKSQVDRLRIVALLKGRPDLLLHELQTELLAATGLRTSLPHLCRVLRSLGWKRKKVHSRQRTGYGREPRTAG